MTKPSSKGTGRALIAALIAGLLLALAAGCAPGQGVASPTAGPTALPASPTAAPTGPPTKAAEATASPTAAASPTLAPSPTAGPPAPFPTPNYFRAVFEPFFGEEGQVFVRGITAEGDGWKLDMQPIPISGAVWGGDYHLATNRFLYWDYSNTTGSGPANLSAGPLHLVDFAAGTDETLIDGPVVRAGWAPDGLAFAYILATPESYELHYRDPAGADRALAADVPHTFSISPNGARIAFTRESNYELETAPGVYVVEIATGAESQVSQVDRAGFGGVSAGWLPIWAPEGGSFILRAFGQPPQVFVYAAADGSWSHAIQQEALLAAFEAQVGGPPAGGASEVWCLSDELALYATNQLVTTVGPCSTEGPGFGPASHLAVFELDPASGQIAASRSLAMERTEEQGIQLAGWNAPGESVFAVLADQVLVLALTEAQ
ncbi:MAG: hypothetical protein ACRDHL_01555 [Candidatus Promineifilaceae bacterium]